MAQQNTYDDVQPQDADAFLIRDVSDTTQNAAGSTKEATGAQVADWLRADQDMASRTVPPNTQTGTAYTLALTDAGGIVEMSNASANTLTIPANSAVAFPVGTIVNVTMLGAGVTTVTGDTGVTVNGVSAGGADISGQFQGVSLYKRGTDEWVMQGAHGTVA
jgi:hypothetical protein